MAERTTATILRELTQARNAQIDPDTKAAIIDELNIELKNLYAHKAAQLKLPGVPLAPEGSGPARADNSPAPGKAQKS